MYDTNIHYYVSLAIYLPLKKLMTNPKSQPKKRLNENHDFVHQIMITQIHSTLID